MSRSVDTAEPTGASRRSGAPTGLRPWEQRVLLAVIYAEIAINVLNGVVSLVSPLAALAPLARSPLSAESAELGRWFGGVTFAFGGWLLARSLSSPPALRLVLEALCVGDVLYLGALLPFAMSYGRPPAIYAPFGLTAIMFAARLYWLVREDWPRTGASMAVDEANAVKRELTAPPAGRRKTPPPPRAHRHQR